MVKTVVPELLRIVRDDMKNEVGSFCTVCVRDTPAMRFQHLFKDAITAAEWCRIVPSWFDVTRVFCAVTDGYVFYTINIMYRSD